MRSAGLRAGAGQALAAERLNADDGADHAAVYIDIADAGGGHDAVDEALDAAMDAEGQAVARVAEPGEGVAELALLVDADVEDRAEHFGARKAGERKLERDRGDVIALACHRRLPDEASRAAQLLDVAQ